MFLNYQQVLDALGRTDGVDLQADAVLWPHVRSHDPGVQNQLDLYFRDGLVVDVDP